MTGFWLASYLVLWVLVVVEALAVVLLIRQNGALLLRLEFLEKTTPSRIERRGLSAGMKAPDFVLNDLEGRTVRLGGFARRKVSLVFTQPSCGPCQTLLPDLTRVAEQHVADGLQVLVVNNGSVEVTRALLNGHEPSFPVLLQEHWKVSREYGAFIAPFAFVIDEQGVIRAKGVVNSQKDIEDLLKA
jgi:methylamine dehydrogenase accessory protein MauD